jgi:DNA polymerase-3 subunit delta'
MVGLLSALPRLPISALHDFAEKVGRQAESFGLFAELFTAWLAQAASLAAGGPARTTQLGEADLQQRLVRQAGLERWMQAWEKLSASFERADAVNLDGRMTVLNAFLALEKLCK